MSKIFNPEDIKCLGHKFEDFQMSKMFMDFAMDGDFKTEVTATVKKGNLIILKTQTKQIKNQ